MRKYINNNIKEKCKHHISTSPLDGYTFIIMAHIQTEKSVTIIFWESNRIQHYHFLTLPQLQTGSTACSVTTSSIHPVVTAHKIPPAYHEIFRTCFAQDPSSWYLQAFLLSGNIQLKFHWQQLFFEWNGKQHRYVLSYYGIWDFSKAREHHYCPHRVSLATICIFNALV